VLGGVSVSVSLIGIAGCLRISNACGNVAPKSAFVELRQRVYQLVSTSSEVGDVKRPVCFAPVALLLGRVRNAWRLTGPRPWTPDMR
jgi:hypothetical protein